jgi:hypothetical protein
MLPHRLVDDAESDRILLWIAARSTSFSIEPIVILLSALAFCCSCPPNGLTRRTEKQ